MPRRSWEDNMRQVLRKQYPNESTFSGNAEKFVRAVQAKHRGEPYGLGDNLKAVAMNCNDSQLTNVLPYLKNFSTIEYLSIRFIHDNSAEQLVSSLGALGVKTLVLADNCITQAGRDIVKQSLSKVPHEVFVSFVNANANSDRTGTAIFKDKSNNIHDLILEPDSGDNCKISLMPSGISGVSAGDSAGVCPAPLKDQIIGCLEGAISIGVAGLVTCGSNPTPAGYPICVARAALIGCGGRTLSIASKPCIENAYSSILGDSNNSGSGGWDVNDPQVSGAYVDNDVSGNIGDYDLGSL